ncbi:MAG: DNA polymerase III subunit [Desulfomonilia bacterium]|jgi:DNA polymerase III delta' subunit
MWKDICGHEGPIAALKGFIREGRIPHALLFTGPMGIGKTMAAREFFKAVNCLESPGEPCDECACCRKVKAGPDTATHPDLLTVSPEEGRQVITVNDIRDMISEIGLKPFEAKTRFVVIEPAEQLNKASSNALLKTLEEPPASTVIILVSHRPSLLLPTIVSRCRALRFAPLDAGSSRDGHLDPALLRLTSGTLGGLQDFDPKVVAEMRTELIEALLEGNPVKLVSRYAPSQEKAQGLLPVVLLLAESVIRDLYVLSRGGDDLVNRELERLSSPPPDHRGLDDAASCLNGIRRGTGENINLSSALSELFMRLQCAAGT